jgi:hypothetical protein
MLQDFSFKIVHQIDSWHLNIDALSRNPINTKEENEDFGCDVMELEIQIETTPPNFGENLHNESIIICLPYSLLTKQLMKN